MGLHAYISSLWRKKPEWLRELVRKKLIKWRRKPAVVRVEKPLRIDRARSIGYRDKQGFVVLRVRVRRGGFARPRPRSGRRPKALGVVKHKVNVSMKEEAINRARKKYPNLYPLGAYWLASDAMYKWYEVIMIDPSHPAIESDRNLSLPPKVLGK